MGHESENEYDTIHESPHNEIIHTVEFSIPSDWIGSEQLRFFEFINGGLLVKTPIIQVKNKKFVHELFWK